MIEKKLDQQIEAILEIKSPINLNKEIYQEYQKYCQTENNQLSVKCLLLQLGISQFNLVNVFVNDELVGLDYVLQESDKVIIIGNIAGGSEKPYGFSYQ